MTVLRNTRLFHFHSKYILFLIFLWCWNSQCFLFSFFFLLFFQSSEVLLLQHRTKSSSVSSWASCWESFCTTQAGSLQSGPSSNPPFGFAHSNALHSMYVHISFSSFFLTIFSAFRNIWIRILQMFIPAVMKKEKRCCLLLSDTWLPFVFALSHPLISSRESSGRWNCTTESLLYSRTHNSTCC